MNRSLIFLAGGQGVRMNTALPKQFQKVGGKEIALYSFEKFLAEETITEIVVVTHQEWRPLFEAKRKGLLFAEPGTTRQESVKNGFLKLKAQEDKVVATHDSARPFISSELIEQVYQAAEAFGAAACALPISYTVKKADREGLVINTVDRSDLYEIQTPQALHYSLMEKGFDLVEKGGISVTDDVSLAEILGYAPKLVEGLKKNLKVTYPEDLSLVELYLK